MLKDEQNCSYNDGGDAKPPKIWSDFSFLQYNGLSLNLKLPFITDNRKLKISIGGVHTFHEEGKIREYYHSLIK